MLLENQNIACISQACLKKITILRLYSVDAHVSAACCIIHVSVWEKPINSPIIWHRARRGCAQTELQLQREACNRRGLGHQMSPASSRRGKNSVWFWFCFCVHRRPLLLLDVRRSERTRRCAQTQQAHLLPEGKGERATATDRRLGRLSSKAGAVYRNTRLQLGWFGEWNLQPFERVSQPLDLNQRRCFLLLPYPWALQHTHTALSWCTRSPR